MKTSLEIGRIGVVRSCFGEKFAAPRQPGLCPSAWGELVFDEEFRREGVCRGLDGFSHLWLLFGFHQTAGDGWNPTVRPPRLGGNERIGVFASRSPFRPNGLGLSLVRLEGLDEDERGGPLLRLGGLDLVDGTPVFDIKPYLPYCEAPPDARGGYAAAGPELLEVKIESTVVDAFAALPERAQAVVIEALSCDPRPAAGADRDRIYGARMCGRNIRFAVEGGACRLIGLDPCPASGLSDAPRCG